MSSLDSICIIKMIMCSICKLKHAEEINLDNNQTYNFRNNSNNH